ncbi:hypothetical protein SeMB42_g03844 [Synchytrium endobioticum]|uniref:Autophagy-related protein 14 n=1 Tax=Synchytrium endobioticum TaxID=286115 RepID=A0A507D3A3_9FUNG|nr:hypothetical protein SeMB42_g03844 [Synchytrium endobioticum]
MASAPSHPVSQLAPKRRIRHLQSIHIRNVALPDPALSKPTRAHPPPTIHTSKSKMPRATMCSLPDTFYELCLPHQPHPVFFQSELKEATCDPDWGALSDAPISPWISPILPDGCPLVTSPTSQTTPPLPLPPQPTNKLIPRMLNSLDNFILKVWARLHNASEYHLIIEAHVRLKHLDYVAHELTVDNWPPNFVLLGLDGMYFTMGDDLAPTPLDRPNPPDDDAPVVKVDGTKIRQSYKYDAITNIIAAQRDIWETYCNTCGLTDHAQHLIHSMSNDTVPLMRLYRDQKSRIALIERDIMSNTQDIQASRHALKDLQNTIISRRRQLLDSQLSREVIRHALESRRDALTSNQLDINRASIHITKRQRDLITDLKEIFPIEQSTYDVLAYTVCGLRLPNSEYSAKDEDKIATALGYTAHLITMIAYYLQVPLRYAIRPMSSRSSIRDGLQRDESDIYNPSIYAMSPCPLAYTVCGLRLPNSDYSAKDEDKIATALGYTAHLITMIAYYLQVPLRYAIRPMSLRSSIRDRVTRQYQDNPEFPLYSKGNDRFRFDYGVFLLNKDVEQLMNYVGLNVSNLRNTFSV